MSVNNVANVSRGFAQYAQQVRNTSNTKSSVTAQADKVQSNLAKVGGAFELEISDAAKQSQQPTTPVAEEGYSVDNADTQKTKGLSNDEVNALKADLEVQQQTLLNVMIQAVTANNDKLQGWLDDGVGILNFDGVQIEASRFALPEVATTPEEAKAAISEGGAWSVEAVSDRIANLAIAISGGDPEKLSQMKSAIEKGVEQAGLTWKDSTGQSKLPDITNDTVNRTMKIIDDEMAKLNGKSMVEN